MQIDRETILQAKEKLGDRNAQIIVEELGITDFDEKNMKCCCPFHQEDHASFIYNKKAFNFRCFGSCGRSYDILDVFMYKGATYAEACKKLFELAEMPYSFGELGVKTKRHYRYPHEVPCTDKSKVYAYFEQRKISRETLDALDVRQDSEGNAVFNYYDTNDVLTMVKYKPSHKVQHGQAKCWCQQNSDTAPLLFNMNRINVNSPLLICEGEPDCLSAIEAGFKNAVSVPLGSSNLHWIDENLEWLDQFESNPYEFITAYLNNANGEEDVKNGNELATLYDIRIVPPRFGLSKDKYLLNAEEKVIAKGISSVKYMNADVANELYELAKAGKPKSFMDLLMQLDEKTHLDTRQRDILVKIDYFAEYGNSKELLRMVDFFSFFKNGTMKKISKDKVTAELEPIIAQYATDKSKSGQPAKSYTFTDLPGLLRHLEVMVRDMHIQDFDLKSKMQIQLENLGYIDLTTNKKEDQRKLVILDIYPLRSKKTKEIWAYALQVRSIGTGKTNRWTIYSELYDRKPLQRYDTIYVPMNGWGERRGYLYLYNYDYVI